MARIKFVIEKAYLVGPMILSCLPHIPSAVSRVNTRRHVPVARRAQIVTPTADEVALAEVGPWDV